MIFRQTFFLSLQLTLSVLYKFYVPPLMFVFYALFKYSLPFCFIYWFLVSTLQTKLKNNQLIHLEKDEKKKIITVLKNNRIFTSIYLSFPSFLPLLMCCAFIPVHSLICFTFLCFWFIFFLYIFEFCFCFFQVWIFSFVVPPIVEKAHKN
jgi:hypothetical protein